MNLTENVFVFLLISKIRTNDTYLSSGDVYSWA